MALNWKWDQKVGTMEIKQGDRTFEMSLYQGNAFLIILHEYEEDGKQMYSLFSFFADKQHAKNCLGLSKGHENIFDRGNLITKVRLNKTKYVYTKELVEMLIRAFDGIQIEIYSEEGAA